LEIKKMGYKSVTLAGYTDNVFTPTFDALLVQNRAYAVELMLNIDLKKLKVKGVNVSVVPGLTVQLVNLNTTVSSRALNRRVVATLRAQ